jgi:hypothetical protein
MSSNRNYKKPPSNNPPGRLKGNESQMFDLHALVDQHIHRVCERGAYNIAKMSAEVADRETERYFKVVSALMGTSTKPNRDPETGMRIDAFSSVRWEPLRPKTRQHKAKLRGYGFRNVKWVSGEKRKYGGIPLKSFLKQMPVFNYVAESSAKYIKVSSDRAVNARYRMYLTPGLTEGFISLEDDTDEMFGDKVQDQKINAPNHYTGMTNEEARPIFRPIMEYFVRQRIPRRINQELRKRGYNVIYT